jgi:hypothetical protein
MICRVKLNPISAMKVNMTFVLLWSAVVLTAGVGSAQTTASQASPSGLSPSGQAQASPAQAKPATGTSGQAVTQRPSYGGTNTQPQHADKSIQVQPRPLFLENVPELTFYQTKANELAFAEYTLSGVAVQIIKAKNPLQLLSPAAPSEYGSGWDNVEWFPASGNGPMFKLFSISF